jgi:hypothetical protein
MNTIKLMDSKKEKLEKVLAEAYYSGERFVIKGKEGSLAAIVPMEDLAVLEEIDKRKSFRKPHKKLY